MQFQCARHERGQDENDTDGPEERFMSLGAERDHHDQRAAHKNDDKYHSQHQRVYLGIIIDITTFGPVAFNERIPVQIGLARRKVCQRNDDRGENNHRKAPQHEVHDLHAATYLRHHSPSLASARIDVGPSVGQEDSDTILFRLMFLILPLSGVIAVFPGLQMIRLG